MTFIRNFLPTFVMSWVATTYFVGSMPLLYAAPLFAIGLALYLAKGE